MTFLSNWVILIAKAPSPKSWWVWKSLKKAGHLLEEKTVALMGFRAPWKSKIIFMFEKESPFASGFPFFEAISYKWTMPHGLNHLTMIFSWPKIPKNPAKRESYTIPTNCIKIPIKVFFEFVRWKTSPTLGIKAQNCDPATHRNDVSRETQKPKTRLHGGHPKRTKKFLSTHTTATTPTPPTTPTTPPPQPPPTATTTTTTTTYEK